MVSFQCNGCGDVVKKPKLDQHHYSGCHSGFDCIDCSTTFQTQSDWKGHTSCITEKEKYEKSVYRAPAAARGGRGRGGSTRGGANGNIKRVKMTGANDTPLGTPPARLSPPVVQDIAMADPETKSLEPKKEKSKKVKKDKSPKIIVSEPIDTTETGQKRKRLDVEPAATKPKKSKDETPEQKAERKRLKKEAKAAAAASAVAALVPKPVETLSEVVVNGKRKRSTEDSEVTRETVDQKPKKDKKKDKISKAEKLEEPVKEKKSKKSRKVEAAVS